METIQAYFGNRTKPVTPKPSETLQVFWRRMLYMSISHRNGDVSLFKGTDMVRTCLNADRTILSRLYPTTYIKH